MKKQLSNAIGKKVFTLLAASALLLGSASTTFALPDRATKEVKSIGISYSGPKDQYLVFKIDYKNEMDQPFQLIIKNEQDDVLYNKKYDAKPLNSDIYLSELPENCKLTFLIRTGKKDVSQTFQVNTTYKTVPELEVTVL